MTTHWLPQRGSRSKYKNYRDAEFDSIMERERYGELLILERAGKIKDLQRQIRIEVIPKTDGFTAVTYTMDFKYFDVEAMEEIWEDCKGARTETFRLKERLIYWKFGKRLRLTRTRSRTGSRQRPKAG